MLWMVLQLTFIIWREATSGIENGPVDGGVPESKFSRIDFFC